MTWGVLRGRDQDRVGRVGALGEGRAGLALSRGGAPKTYRYVDPNEDCAGFACGPGGILLAVADAHNGADASEIAVGVLLERFGEAWTGDSAGPAPWPEQAADAAVATHEAVLQRAAQGGNPWSRSTLAFALLRPGDDFLGWASLGDSHVFLVGADAVELSRGREPASWFLGAPQRAPGEIRARVRSGSAACAGARAVVAVTDGISEANIGLKEPGRAVAEAVERAARAAPELRALEAARHVVERAQEAHRENRAGDNVAVAVGWLGA